MEREAQRYARHLFPLRHGYPLWIPEPNEDLPPEYTDEGTRIGDVGIITDDGCFDFLFNICVTVHDPINQSRGVPSNFTPLTWNGHIVKTGARFRPGVPICSLRAKQRQLSLEASAAVPGSPLALGGGIEVSFQKDSGAVLMPQNGALRIDCTQLASFRAYAERNANDWYQFVNGTLGHEAENGSLYLVTGFVKANAWETALFDSTSSSHSCSLVFTSGGIADGRMKLSQSSILQTSVTSRCSSSDANNNQTLFIRGFRISLRQRPSAWLRGGIRIASTYSSSRQDIFDTFGRSHPGSQRDRGGNPSGGGQNNGGSPSSSSNPSSDESGIGDSGDYTSSDSSTEADDTLPSRPYHPLNFINDYILQSGLEVDVVVTHDNEWIALLTEEDTEMPDDQTMLQRFGQKYYVSVQNGYAVLHYIDDGSSVSTGGTIVRNSGPGLRPMQRPTITFFRIRSSSDAHVIFHAVSLNLLPIVSRRLDTEERRSISSGCVFVWEERGSNAEATGLGIERWTDSLRWGPSRVKDDFLFYREKEPELTELELLSGSHGISQQSVGRGYFRENLIKQTYSVFVETPRGRRKWHLIAYFTQDSLEYLRTIDDIPALANLHVPPGKYITARTGKPRRSTAGALDGRDPFGHPSSGVHQGSLLVPYPTPSPSLPRSSPLTEMLAPLEYLEKVPSPRRHPVDEEALMAFNAHAHA